ncbi:anaerobic ribonucleoside-triphosphate reductase [Mailhella massiliensis]|uniref:anaerobic ribonucleoside-triphosphate reductase n=1 Tax=Mailhella massiliensis TaxID=1903261 RepID=UPI00097DE5E9|nr:anaerobic ribonucleoside-triphosphate reductase [Mailhella massiliensis]
MVAGGDGVMEKLIGQGVHFERIRRITGYLVGALDRFNNAKRVEEHDRVKHMNMEPWKHRAA